MLEIDRTYLKRGVERRTNQGVQFAGFKLFERLDPLQLLRFRHL